MKRQPLFFLHGTASGFLPSIEKEGLIDPYLTDSEKMAAYFAKQAHVTRHPEVMELLSRGDLSLKGSQPVILQVAVFDENRLRADREMLAEPLDWIKAEHGIERDQEWFEAIQEGIIESPESGFDWETSLKMLHAVKYEGTIPPRQLGVARWPRIRS